MKFYNYLLEATMTRKETESIFNLTSWNKETLKKRYRELSHKYHPDLGGDEEMMKKVNAAFQILSKVNNFSSSSSGSSDFKAWSEKRKKEDEKNLEIGKKIKNDILNTLKQNEHKFVDYFNSLSGKSFSLRINKAEPKDTASINDPKSVYYTNGIGNVVIETEFITPDENIIFTLNIFVSVTMMGGGKGLSSGDEYNYSLNTTTYGFAFNKKQKLSSRDWGSTSDHTVLSDPKKLFPQAKLKKIFSGSSSKRKFSKRDMYTFLDKKLNASNMNKDSVKIPITDDYYLVLYRMVFMRVPGWGINGLYKKFNRISMMPTVIMPETEETAQWLEEIIKQAKKSSSDEQSLINTLKLGFENYKKQLDKSK